MAKESIRQQKLKGRHEMEKVLSGLDKTKTVEALKLVIEEFEGDPISDYQTQNIILDFLSTRIEELI